MRNMTNRRKFHTERLRNRKTCFYRYPLATKSRQTKRIIIVEIENKIESQMVQAFTRVEVSKNRVNSSAEAEPKLA